MSYTIIESKAQTLAQFKIYSTGLWCTYSSLVDFFGLWK